MWCDGSPQHLTPFLECLELFMTIPILLGGKIPLLLLKNEVKVAVFDVSTKLKKRALTRDLNSNPVAQMWSLVPHRNLKCNTGSRGRSIIFAEPSHARFFYVIADRDYAEWGGGDFAGAAAVAFRAHFFITPHRCAKRRVRSSETILFPRIIEFFF